MNLMQLNKKIYVLEKYTVYGKNIVMEQGCCSITAS